MPVEGNQKFNKCLLYILIFCMILTGSINTIVNKIIHSKYVLDQLFKVHHWFFIDAMFLGEFISFFIYIYISYKKKNKEQNENQNNNENQGEEIKKKSSPPIPTNLIFVFTSLLDLLSAALSIFGLSSLYSSIYQMFRGFQLIFICLLGKLFLKNQYYRQHILGICSIILGLGSFGLIEAKKGNSNFGKQTRSVILLLISQIFSSTQNIIQEIYIKNYDVHPLKFVGYEGLYGIIIYTILLIIFQNIYCDSWTQLLKEEICSINDKEKSYLEDSIFAFRQMWKKKSILFLSILYIISIALYNIVGINLTKLDSSTTRVVVDNARIIFIWLFFFFYQDSSDENNHDDKLQETFLWTQFIGLLFLFFGASVYNEIIVLHFWGLDKYTKTNIEKLKKEEYIAKLQKENEDNDLLINISKNIIDNSQSENNVKLD